VRQTRSGVSRSSATVRVAPAAGALVSAVCLVMSGTATAVPPPPPNPSDSEIEQGRETVQGKADEVGDLVNRLASAEAELTDLKDQVARKLEHAKKAMVDLRRARKEAQQAKKEAADTEDAVESASERVRRAQEKLDEFVAGSYQQGSRIGSVSAYLGSEDATELLERAQLLESLAGSGIDALENMQQAQTVKANKESAAREALREAKQKRSAAEQAKQDAEAAKQAAIEAREQQADRIEDLEDKKASIEDELATAREHVGSLEAQREEYEDWQERKRAEERSRRTAARADNGSSGSGGGTNGTSGVQTATVQSDGSAVEQVISRAKSALGVQYAWGGGNAQGPTLGIRDGGVADAHGDWKKVGFDCSGLMTYAFAPVEKIPSYSGYQYSSGQRVPVSQKQRGDMLFWGPGGSTHVALYLGNGMMLEAPYSGGHVRIAPVRQAGIAPYAVRLV